MKMSQSVSGDDAKETRQVFLIIGRKFLRGVVPYQTEFVSETLSIPTKECYSIRLKETQTVDKSTHQKP